MHIIQVFLRAYKTVLSTLKYIPYIIIIHIHVYNYI